MNNIREPLVPFNHPRRSKLAFQSTKSESDEGGQENSNQNIEEGPTSPMVKRKKPRSTSKITFDKTVNLRVGGFDGIQHIGYSDVLNQIPKGVVRKAARKVLKKKGVKRLGKKGKGKKRAKGKAKKKKKKTGGKRKKK